MNEVSNENNDLLHNEEATVESSFSNDIFLLEEEADIAEFLKCIEESDAVVGSGQRSNYWVDISDIINMMSFPITIVYEKCYVDKVYRDSYYMYFA
ncbi:MAG: hypothetical protein LIO65_06175, partial [Odoribacter sp.]|nr:hypothetical protein [Odoribacter sp.]